MIIRTSTKICLVLSLMLSTYFLKSQVIDDKNCNDILGTYTSIPKDIENKLEFVDCTYEKTNVEIWKETYTIKPEDVMLVQEFFIEKYGFGKMKWIDEHCHDGMCIMSSSPHGELKFPSKLVNLKDKKKNLFYHMTGYYDILKVPNREKFNQNFIKTYKIEISIQTDP